MWKMQICEIFKVTILDNRCDIRTEWSQVLLFPRSTLYHQNADLWGSRTNALTSCTIPPLRRRKTRWVISSLQKNVLELFWNNHKLTFLFKEETTFQNSLVVIVPWSKSESRRWDFKNLVVILQAKPFFLNTLECTGWRLTTWKLTWWWCATFSQTT